MADFEQCKEYQQSEKMRPACDRVFKLMFGEYADIRRPDRGGILDKTYHIDCDIYLPDTGIRITAQEKALTYEFAKYNTFTMEFYQNRHTKERGEFFKIASQIYLSGYSDATGTEFGSWHIISVLHLMSWLATFDEATLASKTRPSTGNASFLPISYTPDSKWPGTLVMPKEAIFSSGDLWESTPW